MLIIFHICFAIKRPKQYPKCSGLWMTIKKVDLLVHVFHVSRLTKYLLHDDSVLDGIVELKSPSVVD